MASWLAATCAALVAVTLLGGVVALVKDVRPWRPWLAVLFAVHSGYRETTRDALRGARPVDVALLALASAAYGGFWPGLGTSHVWWMALAIAQPVLGIPLLVASGLQGRSGLMGGGLVLSALMVVDGTWTTAGWCGLVATGLLLVGDFGTTGRRSPLLAALIAIGFVALVGWFGWLAVILRS